MNILEFVGGLEAIPPALARFARNKAELATYFGIDMLPASLPIDVNLTRIPDQALDGYLARLLLIDDTIAKENFADYAFTVSAIFAAQQVSMRSGLVNRGLDSEYPYFIFRTINPCWRRILLALDNSPLIMNWWPKGTETFDQTVVALKFAQLMNARYAQEKRVEQVLHAFSCPDTSDTTQEVQIAMTRFPLVVSNKIGLLVMSGFSEVGDYIEAFRRLQPRLTDLGTVLIYDKRSVVDLCATALASMHQWRGTTLKHLAYQKELGQDDYALLVLQANFYNCG